MISFAPDNYDRFIIYESEQERLKRLQKRFEYEESLELENIPFYYEEREDNT